MLIDFKDEDFDNKIKNENVSVIQFSAAWCGPCKTLKPVMDKLADEYKDKAGFYYADIEDDLVNKDLELIKKEQLPNHIANAIEYLLFIEDMKPQIIPYATICKRTSTKHRAQNYYKSFFKLLLKTNPEVRARITRIYKMYVEFVIEAEPIVKRTKGQPLTKENIQKTI